MMPFFKNWLHYVRKAELSPVILGAADVQMYQMCTRDNVAALTLAAGLDVWNYTIDRTVSNKALTIVQNGSSEWKYYRHHKSSFLEIGLVKAAFLWELLRLGYDVLISDLDVVWLRGGWERWMSYRNPRLPPLPEARLMAMADVLVSTDELDTEYDAHGTWNRWPFGLGWGWRAELNTGVVHFRATNGSLAFVQAWRRAMLAKRNVEHTNDQFIFIAMVREAQMEAVTSQAALLDAWRTSLRSHGLLREEVLRSIGPSTRGVSISKEGFQLATPCLDDGGCAPARFTLGTLPLRSFTGGHTYFMQRVQNFEGHAHAKNLPLTVHFTFQYSDTPDFPHGKRQRAREAGLWAVDPPEYFTEGLFVRIVGPLYTAAQRERIFRRFPEWSPQRHMHLDAIQRSATRDLLALSWALNGSMIMPPFTCACDRYWGFTENCRMPTAPQEMPFPFRCSQDALFEIKFWNDKKVNFREADFLDHPNVPPEVVSEAVRVVVKERNVRTPSPGSAEARMQVVLKPGTPMSEVRAAVRKANPNARLVEIQAADLKRLCKWLGSTSQNKAFNNLQRYVLHESSRYCPREDHDESVSNVPNWNWRNPFSAFNCTWGMAAPADFPEPKEGEPGGAAGRPPCAIGQSGVALRERESSMTCARSMLCDVHVEPDGRQSKPLDKASRCNLEGYGGVDYETYGTQISAALKEMPDGRCPMPPGDVPGPGPGFDAGGHYVGLAKAPGNEWLKGHPVPWIAGADGD